MNNAINNTYSEATPLLLAVDCIIFGFDRENLKLLLFKRRVAPFKGSWSLIGSFIKNDENFTDAPRRVLKESTGLDNVYMEQINCYGDLERDPGGRVLSVSHYALIRLEEQEKSSVEKHHAKWFSMNEVPPLILDHNQMVEDAFKKLKDKARHRPIGFELLPEKFTLPQLQLLYESIYQRPLDRRNFRRKILAMNILEKLDEKDKETSKKGAYLYRFNKEEYEKKVASGFNFEV